MFEFVSKALLALVLDKRAREALEAANRSPSAHSTKSAGLPSPAEAGRAKSGPSAPGSVKPSPSAPPRGRELTDERRELIRNALAVQRSKQHVFDDLSEDTKAKLLITAVKAMGIPPDEIERSLLGRRKSSNSGPKR